MNARLFSTCLLSVSLTALASTARADVHADAEAAFREGRQLLDAGKLEEACARLAESQKLEPAAGTLLNLADCYERRGLLASAADTYKEAAVAAALRSRTDWEQFALQHYNALRPQVPKLMIHVPGHARVDGLVVQRDGLPIASREEWTEELVDPGTHTVSASAPDRKPWSTTVTVAAGAKQEVAVPVLVASAYRAASPGAESTSWQRPTGFVLAGVGAAAIGFGAVAGLVAIGGRSDAESKCPSYPSACTQEGTDANERARDWATMSTIGFVAGGVLVAGGVTLLLTAPKPSASGANGSMTTRLGVTGAGRLELSGSF